jgi:hypothetical protein
MSGVSGAATANDPVTLKAQAPTIATPGDGTEVASTTPTLTVANATGLFVALPADAVYRFQVRDPGGSAVAEAVVVAGGNGTTSFTLPSALIAETVYSWFARVESGGRVGPWSSVATFVTPVTRAASPAPGPAGGGGGGPVGPNRTISPSEVLAILINVHDTLGFNLGSSSSREGRIDWLWTSMAVVHYGHSRFNPAGGDPGWCVKSASSDRPPSDDVIVRCSSAEAWDTVLGAGANGYSFHLEPLGSIAGQVIYAPPSSSLPALR